MLVASISHSLFGGGIPILEKVIRTVAVYAGIVLLLRLAGKRELTQLNTFDLVVLLLLSNVVQNAIIGPDNTLIGGLLGAAVLLGMNALVVRYVRRGRPWAVWLFEGSPTTLVRDGEVDRAAVAKEGLREADVLIALRMQGATDVHQVREAVLRPGGRIEVELDPSDTNATRGDVARLETKLDELIARS